MAGKDVRERVLEAGLELLSENGVRWLTQPQVAKRAGVRQSHLTYYFPRRADLIGAVARRYIEAAAVELMELFQRGDSQDLGQLLMGFAYRQVSDRRRARGLLGLLVASEEDAALRQQLVEAMSNLRGLIAHAMGVEAGHPAATVMQATLWGLGINNLLMMDVTDEAELKRLLEQVARQSGVGVTERARKRTRRRRKGAS